MIESAAIQFGFKGFLAFGGLFALLLAIIVIDRTTFFDMRRDYDKAEPNYRLMYIGILIASACYVIGNAL